MSAIKPSVQIMARAREKAAKEFHGKMDMATIHGMNLVGVTEEQWVKDRVGWFIGEAIMEHLDHLESDLLESLEKIEKKIDGIMQPIQ